jgi:hypothetical protein
MTRFALQENLIISPSLAVSLAITVSVVHDADNDSDYDSMFIELAFHWEFLNSVLSHSMPRVAWYMCNESHTEK